MREILRKHRGVHLPWYLYTSVMLYLGLSDKRECKCECLCILSRHIQYDRVPKKTAKKMVLLSTMGLQPAWDSNPAPKGMCILEDTIVSTV